MTLAMPVTIVSPPFVITLPPLTLYMPVIAVVTAITLRLDDVSNQALQ